VPRHLALLRRGGMVARRSDGREAALVDPRADRVEDYLRDLEARVTVH
jgi:hypothetical protein